LFSRLRGAKSCFLIKCWNFWPFTLHINIWIDIVFAVLTQVMLISFLFHYKSSLSRFILIVWFNTFELFCDFLTDHFFCLGKWELIFLLSFSFPIGFFKTCKLCLNVYWNLWMREKGKINELLFEFSLVLRRMQFDLSRICESFIAFSFWRSWIMERNIAF